MSARAIPSDAANAHTASTYERTVSLILPPGSPLNGNRPTAASPE